MPDVRNHLLFTSDNLLDIGASGATRPRNLFLGGAATIPTLTVSTAATLPNGSVTTPMIAADAVQQLIGQYATNTTFSTTAVSSWVSTGVTVTATSAGGLLRLEFAMTILHSVANGQFYLGLGIDGVPTASLLEGQSVSASAVVPVSGVRYLSGVSAASHTFTAYLYNVNIGTLSLKNDVLATLYVTEQKR